MELYMNCRQSSFSMIICSISVYHTFVEGAPTKKMSSFFQYSKEFTFLFKNAMKKRSCFPYIRFILLSVIFMKGCGWRKSLIYIV